MVWVRFEEVKRQATKSGACACGKRRTRSKTFIRTINPYNTNDRGEEKSRKEVWDDMSIDVAVWLAEPITCRDCDGSAT